jgi:hypothetical protein
MDSEPDDPTEFGRYRVVGRMADDSLGRVLIGIDETQRRAAIRLISPELGADAGFRERLAREIQVAAQAPAWFVAPVLDADPSAEPPWVVSVLAEGPTLAAFVTANGPLGEHGALALAGRMADGLVALHGAGLAHRDLTPANVVLADDGPRLVNFGIGRAADQFWLAREGKLAGMPEFLAPEARTGAAAGPAADIYSLAAVVAYAATGRTPGTPVAAESATLDAGPLDLGPITGPFRDIMVACLAVDPAARPPAEKVREVLATVELSGAPTVTVYPSPFAAAPPSYAQPTYVGPPLAPPADGGRRTGPMVVAGILGAAVALVIVLVAGNALGWFGGGSATPTGTAATPAPAPGPTPPDINRVYDAATDDRFGTDAAEFVTPSGNITCRMDTDEVRCDVAQQTWKLPAKPADCTGDFGTGTVLTGTAPAELSCVSDSLADPSLETLEYGTAVRRDGVLCASRENGVRCENEQTHHGFQVARAAFELF